MSFACTYFFTISKTHGLFLKAHSSVERAGLIACIKMRSLPTDEETSLRGQTLRDAIDKDRAQGLIPIYVSTSWLKGFQNVMRIWNKCKRFADYTTCKNIWVPVRLTKPILS